MLLIEQIGLVWLWLEPLSVLLKKRVSNEYQ